MEQEKQSLFSSMGAKERWLIALSVALVAVLVVGAWLSPSLIESGIQGDRAPVSLLEKRVLPAEGILVPAKWGDFGAKLVESGVIDSDKLEILYSQRGGMTPEYTALLYGNNNGNLTINEQNAGFVLNLLWAFGLANKNRILEQGPMMDAKYGGDASRFASTGGWRLSQGDSMEHYSRHSFVALTQEQQAIVERVSKGIYRPCCNNPTYFPDCNHGMAMLGLLELMAASGVSEQEMYRVALQVNAYWFPDTYLTIAKYLEEVEGISWEQADPKILLGFDFSSASGFQRVLSKVEPPERQGGGSCGV